MGHRIELPKPMMRSPEDCPYPGNQRVRYDSDDGEIRVCTGCEFLKFNVMNDRWTCVALPKLIEFQKKKRFKKRGEEHRKFRLRR